MPHYDNIEIVDSHHHFWDLNKNYYPFLCDKIDPNFFLGKYEIIRQNYLPVDMKRTQKIIMLLVLFIVKQNGIGMTRLVRQNGKKIHPR